MGGNVNRQPASCALAFVLAVAVAVVLAVAVVAPQELQTRGCPIFAAVSSRLRWECTKSNLPALALVLVVAVVCSLRPAQNKHHLDRSSGRSYRPGLPSLAWSFSYLVFIPLITVTPFAVPDWAHRL